VKTFDLKQGYNFIHADKNFTTTKTKYFSEVKKMKKLRLIPCQIFRNVEKVQILYINITNKILTKLEHNSLSNQFVALA